LEAYSNHQTAWLDLGIISNKDKKVKERKKGKKGKKRKKCMRKRNGSPNMNISVSAYGQQRLRAGILAK